MNDLQKRFLRELHELFMKYEVDSMVICDDRIVFSSNYNTLSCECYIKRSNDESAYFGNIATQTELFTIDIN